jgi:urease accessory protein
MVRVMRVTTRGILWAAAAVAWQSPSVQPAYAHGFGGSGWLHPLTGPDHMLAMLAVGAWSAQLGGAALYRVPAAFVFAMAAGFGVGLNRWPVPGTEIMIAMSVLGLGLAIALDKPIAWLLATLAIAIFGLAHGYAHGAEMPESAGAASYVMGFLVTTAGLHVAGATGALLTLERTDGQILLRLTGAAVGLAGVWFLLALADQSGG